MIPWAGTTLDQIAAQHFGQGTSLPSIEVGTEERGGGGKEGSCDRNYGCSYGKTISFRDPSTPLPMEHNPRKLFQQLFGQGRHGQRTRGHAQGKPESARPGVP